MTAITHYKLAGCRSLVPSTKQGDIDQPPTHLELPLLAQPAVGQQGHHITTPCFGTLA
jgi:hypothetical protein